MVVDRIFHHRVVVEGFRVEDVVTRRVIRQDGVGLLRVGEVSPPVGQALGLSLGGFIALPLCLLLCLSLQSGLFNALSDSHGEPGSSGLCVGHHYVALGCADSKLIESFLARGFTVLVFPKPKPPGQDQER